MEKAFADTVRDPHFLAEMKKLDLDVSPVAPAAIETLLLDLYAAPKMVLAKAASTMAGQSFK